MTTRRQAIAMAAAAAALPAWPAEAQTVRRRFDVNTAAGANMLRIYARGVGILKDLPVASQLSWTSIARVHLNSCPHGNWFLLPWHRQYVLMLEEIIRGIDLPGFSTFTLPYWNWTNNRRIPAAFTDPSSPLFHPERRAGPGATVPFELVSPATLDAIMGQTLFERFGSSRPTGQTDTSAVWQRRPGVSGRFEAGPHNGVHNFVGGTMSTNWSPLDPIFFLHHGNVDRLWLGWLRSGRSNPTDALWREFRFLSNFLRPRTGVRFSATVATIRIPAYDRVPTVALAEEEPLIIPASFELAQVPRPPREPRQPRQPRPPRVFSARPERAARRGRPLDVAIDLRGEAGGRSRVSVLGIPYPGTGAPYVRVFVNTPGADASTPTEGRNYLGTVSFFGHDEHAAHEGVLTNFSLDGPALAGATSVQLVPVELDGAGVSDVEIMPSTIDVELY